MANVNISIENRTFKDLDLNFTAHPVKKDITKTLNEYAIVNSVKNLVLTNFTKDHFNQKLEVM